MKSLGVFDKQIQFIHRRLLLVVSRIVPDLLFSNPAGAGFCRILMANPAGVGEGAGFFIIATS